MEDEISASPGNIRLDNSRPGPPPGRNKLQPQHRQGQEEHHQGQVTDSSGDVRRHRGGGGPCCKAGGPSGDTGPAATSSTLSGGSRPSRRRPVSLGAPAATSSGLSIAGPSSRSAPSCASPCATFPRLLSLQHRLRDVASMGPKLLPLPPTLYSLPTCRDPTFIQLLVCWTHDIHRSHS